MRTISQESEARSATDGSRQVAVSPALEWLWGHFQGVRPLDVLDCGRVSQATVGVLLRRGAKVHVADLICLVWPGDPRLWDRNPKQPRFRLEEFFAQSPQLAPQSLTAIFCWHLLDLLPREALAPVVGWLWAALRPKGALFCLLRQPNLPAGADAVWSLESLTKLVFARRADRPFPYPALHNRDMERLVPGATVKTFLSRSGRRETLAVK